MSLTLPPAKNYQSPLIALPSRLLRDPPDGPRQIGLEFDWTTMGITTGSQTAIFVNLSNNATLRFSQIVALKVDNSQCGADVLFVFTDTQETVLIPAYTPDAVVPVFTDQTQFYAIAQGTVLTNDVTRCQVLNFVPPPVTISASTEQNIVSTNGLFMNAVGATIIPNTVSGTMTSLLLTMSVPVAPAGPGAAQSNIGIQDGAANQLLNTLAVAVPAGVTVPYSVLLDVESLNWRFKNGVTLSTTPAGWGAAPGLLNVLATYRTP